MKMMKAFKEEINTCHHKFLLVISSLSLFFPCQCVEVETLLVPIQHQEMGEIEKRPCLKQVGDFAPRIIGSKF